MHTIFFIPGLGCDERLYAHLQLDGYQKRFIKWVKPFHKETLHEYAKRLSSQIDTKSKFSLVGTSFGGMIALEMSKFLSSENLILISSAKTYKEIPFSLRFFYYFPIYKILSEEVIRWIFKMSVHRVGIYQLDDVKLFLDMLSNCPAGYLRRAIDMIMRWRNTEYPDKTVQINGDKDDLFPITLIAHPVIVKGGRHFMPYHKADEVEKIIRERINLPA